MSSSADYLRNYWKKYAIARRLLQDSDAEYSENGESAYYTSLKQSILGEVNQMRGFLWKSMGFIQDPSIYGTENFFRTELVRFTNDFSGFAPQWCGFGNGNGNARRSCYIFNQDNATSQGLSLYNDNSVIYPIDSSPAIGSDGIVYICNSGGYLFACILDSSQTLITVSVSPYYLEAACHSSPAIGCDGTIYIGSDNGKLTALKFNGLFFTKQWDYTTKNTPIRSSPVIGNDGTIYFGSDDSFLYAISPNGALKWVGPAGAIANSGGLGLISGKMRSSPAIRPDGTIVVGSDGGTLYWVDPNNGNMLGSIDLEGQIATSPVVGSDGMVYVSTTSGVIYAFKLAKQIQIEWLYTTSMAGISDFIEFSSINTITGYFTTAQTIGSINNGDRIQFDQPLKTESSPYPLYYIQNYNIDNAGNQTFQVSSSYGGNNIITNLTYTTQPKGFLFLTNLTSPSINSYGSLVVGSSNGNVYMFNKSKIPSIGIVNIGSAVLEGGPVSSITSSPILCGTDIYILCNDGSIYNIPTDASSSLRGESKQITRVTERTSSSSPAISRNGVIYVGDNLGQIFSIYSGIVV